MQQRQHPFGVNRKLASTDDCLDQASLAGRCLQPRRLTSRFTRRCAGQHPARGDRFAGVLFDQVGVDRRRGVQAGRRRADHLRFEVGDVAGDPHPGDRRVTGGTGRHGAAHDLAAHLHIGRLQPERGEHARPRGEAWLHHHGLAGDHLTGAQPHPGKPVAGHLQGGDLPLHHRDAAGIQLLAHVPTRLRRRVQQHRHVVAQLPEQQRLVHHARAAGQDGDHLVAHLPAVAVRAVQHIASPPLRHPGHVRQLIGQPRGDQQTPGQHAPGQHAPGDHAPGHHVPGQHGLPVGQHHPEAGAVPPVIVQLLGRRDRAGHHLPAVPGQLGAARGEQVARRGSLAAQVVVDLRGGGVARIPGIHHQHRAAAPGQGHSRAEPRRAPADDHHVVHVLVHERFSSGCACGRGWRPARHHSASVAAEMANLLAGSAKSRAHHESGAARKAGRSENVPGRAGCSETGIDVDLRPGACPGRAGAAQDVADLVEPDGGGHERARVHRSGGVVLDHAVERGGGAEDPDRGDVLEHHACGCRSGWAPRTGPRTRSAYPARSGPGPGRAARCRWSSR